MARKVRRRTPKSQLRYLGVGGIKSVRDYLEIEIAPLTILAGANSSGKSSVMQPLLMVKQTLESPFDPGPLLISGANTNFSRVSEMLWHAPGQAADELTLSYVERNGDKTKITFGTTNQGLELVSQESESPTDEVSVKLSRNSNQETLRKAIPKHFHGAFDDMMRENGVELGRWRSFFQVSIKGLGVQLRSGNSLSNVATSLIHLPGLRDVPERFYPATEVGDTYPGVFQPYVASVIASWGYQKDPRLAEVGRQMSALGLSWKVQARRLDDTRVELMVGRLPKAQQGGAKDVVNIADVGLGVSQTLPILVALLAARPGQTVFLEQPEIHLHPRAQVALAPILLDAARRGVYVIAETHSNLLLRAIQEAAAIDSKLSEIIRLHWFSRNLEGVTRVNSAGLGEDGSFGDWPVDFADVELDIEERYLNAAMDS